MTSLIPPTQWFKAAETTVLECILLDETVLGQVSGIVAASDFFLREHQVIFRAMQSLATAHKPIELITVVDELARRQQLDGVGIAYVASLGTGTARVSNVEHYAKAIREKSSLRTLAHTALRISDKAYSPDADLEALCDELDNLARSNREKSGGAAKLTFRSAEEVSKEASAVVDWVCDPLLAVGCLTELCGKIKRAGKTTLALHGSAAITRGSPFLGFRTKKSPVIYLTEQPKPSFHSGMELAGIALSKDFVPVYWDETQGATWGEIVRQCTDECKRRGARLLVIDTLGQFAQLAGDSENNAGDALSAIKPLQAAAAQGLAVLIIRHERKGGGELGDSARGSTAFGGAVDTILSLRRSEGHSRPTIRTLEAVSRFPSVPPSLVIELTDQGYRNLGCSSQVAVDEAKSTILLNAGHNAGEAKDLAEMTAHLHLSRTTTQNALAALISEGKLTRIGQGKKKAPHRYFISVPDE